MNIKIDGRSLNYGNEAKAKEELTKLRREVNSFTSLFSREQRERMENVFSNNLEINFCINYRGENALTLSDVGIIGYDDFVGLRQRLNLNVNRASSFIKKHELWHALNKPAELHTFGEYISGHGCIKFVKQTFDEYRESRRDDMLESGCPIEEGMANVMAVLATIKEKAINEGRKDILRQADEYMDTGKVGSALSGVFRGYYVPLEEITRLFILASRNDYMLTHPFSEVLASEEGLDGSIGEPVNKPYCSIISSSVKGDFEFQKEFDSYIQEYNLLNNETLPTYDDICGWLQETQMDNIQNGKGIDSIEKWEIIVNTIQKFYMMKIVKIRIAGLISYERGMELIDEFNKSCEVSKKNLRQRYTTGR